MNKRKIAIIILLISLFFGLFISHKQRVVKRNYSDFNCFYVTGKRVLEHKNIYVLRDSEVAEFRYTPVFANLMSAFALLDENSADTLWFILNFILALGSFYWLHKIIIKENLGAKNLLILYLLLIFGTFRFILHNFDAGQSNILMMACMFAGLYFIENKKEELGALIFAFSIMIKYTPVIFIPYFLLRRRFKLGFFLIGFCLIYIMLPSLFIGLKENLEYLRGLWPHLTNSTILDQFTVLDPKNQSLLSMIQRSFTRCSLYFHSWPMPLQALKLSPRRIEFIFLVASTVFYFLALYKRKNGTAVYKPVIDYALLTVCVILFNLNAWKPTFVLMLMPYFVIIYYLIKDKFRDKPVLALLVASFILNIITMDAFLGKDITYKLCFYSPLTLSALAVFVALLKMKFTNNAHYS